MGPKWYHEDSHARSGFKPKLILTGRLSGTFAGRPVEIESEENLLRVKLDSLQSALELRHSVTTLSPLLRLADTMSLDMRVQVGFLDVRILPNPSTVVRWLAPGLARILEN